MPIEDTIMFNLNKPTEIDTDQALVIVICNGNVLVPKNGVFSLLDYTSCQYLPLDIQFKLAIGSIDTKPLIVMQAASEYSDESLSKAGFMFTQLWTLLSTLSELQTTFISRAMQLLYWHNEHLYCGTCGSKNNLSDSQFMMSCAQCSKEHWPKISPCVIVLICKQDYFLLGRNKNFNIPIYSTIAGFIEAGETAEDTIHREIKEEVGVEVNNIRYFGSQAWPFPSQLMLGYFADYVSGEVTPDGDEIISADFFHYTKLPNTPRNSKSIAGQLINHKILELEARDQPQ